MPRRETTSGSGGGAQPPGWAIELVEWISRRRRAILVTTLLLTLAASLSLLRLRLDVDLVSMLPKGRERFTDYQTYVRDFGAQDLAVALVHAPDASTATRFAEAFAAALRERPEILEVRSRIDLAAFADALAKGALPRLLPLDAYPELERRLTPAAIDESVRTLHRTLTTPGTVGLSAQIERDPLGLSRLLADALAQARPDRALDLGSEYLLSPDGKRLLVLIRPAFAGYGSQGVEHLEALLVAAEKEARAASSTGDEIEVTYTGAFAYGRDDSALLRADMALYNTLALLGVLTVFHLGYRNLRILPFVIAQLLATTLVTFALGLLVFGHLNAVSLAFAAIFFGLSIDTAIYFYTRFLEEWDGGERLEAALAATVGALVVPATVASATTAAVFAVIGLSALTGVAQLGSITALGILLNLPATFVLLPALMLSLGRRAGPIGPPRVLRPTTRLAAIAVYAARHRGMVRATALAAFAACAALASRISLDTDLFHLRPAHSPAADVQQEIREAFGMSDPDGVVLVEAEVGPTVSSSERNQRAEAALQLSERVRDWLVRMRDAGLVREVVSPAPFLPSQATQEARLRAWAALPRAAAARELERRLSEQGFAVERFGVALEALRGAPAPVDATTAPLPGLELLLDRHLHRSAGSVGIVTQFSPNGAADLERIAERMPAELSVPDGLRLVVTGRPLMELELGRTMRREIVWFLVLALLTNGLIIAARERSLVRTLALLSVPSGVVVVLVGIAALARIALDPVNLIVLPLTIGIGVDYCVYLAERVRETGSVEEATARSGRGLAMTAGTTVIGFGVLGLSRYPALSGLGTLAALAMALSFAGSICVLPAVLPLSTSKSTGAMG